MSKKVKETALQISDDNAELAYHVEVKKSFWNKVRFGTAATIFTCVFIAVLIGLNIVVSIAAERFNLSWDLTEKSLFTVSNRTIEYLNGLEENVELIVLSNEVNWRDTSSSATSLISAEGGSGVSTVKYIVETLDRYDETSEKVHLYYVEPLYNPQFFIDRNNLPTSDGLKDQEGNVDSPIIVVYSPDTQRYRFIRASSFNDVQYLDLENRLNAAIRYTTKPDLSKIAVIKGHGEHLSDKEDEFLVFQAVIEDDGYEVEEINLPELKSADELSEYQMLIIVNPERQYSETDLSKIDSFLSNNEELGKSLLVLCDFEYMSKGGADNLLSKYLSSQWGIAFENQVIYDPDNSRTLIGGTNSFMIRYDEDAGKMTGNLATGDYKLRFEVGKTVPLNVSFPLYDGRYFKDDVTVYKLLTTYDSAFSRFQASVSAKEVKKQLETDAVGPFNVGLMAQKVRFDGLSEYDTTVAVFGSTSLLDAYYLLNSDGENQATQEYLAQLLNFMVSQSEDLFEHIQTVSLKTQTLSFEKNSQVVWVFVVTVAIIPIVFLIASFILYKRRKYL